jgi:hypothetical protein
MWKDQPSVTKPANDRRGSTGMTGYPHGLANAHHVARERLGAVYAPFYAAVSVISLMLMFFPMFGESIVDEETGVVEAEYDSLFTIAGQSNGGDAAFGLFLLAVLFVMLVAAAFRVQAVSLMFTMAGVTAVVALMLYARPNTGNPPPDLSPAGLGGLSVLIMLFALTMSHAVRLVILNLRSMAPMPG